MNCTSPLYALDEGFDRDTGKKRIKLLPKRADFTLQDYERRYGASSIILLPCGSCLACKTNHAKEWSVRCMLEAQYYSDNWFLTLTYNDEHLVTCFDEVKNDVQLFMKRLRKISPGVRFLCVGERGERHGRLHSHLILFNCKLDDVSYIGRSKSDGPMFGSKTIEKLWTDINGNSKGLISLGYVTPETCEYVARYSLKKRDGDEFMTVSNRPGIGYQYLLDHKDSIYDTDGVYIRGRKFRVPRYFDKILEVIDNPLYCMVKFTRNDEIYSRARRFHLLSQSGFEFDEQLYLYQADVNINKLRMLKKGGL